MIGLHRALGLSKGSAPANDPAHDGKPGWDEFHPDEPAGARTAPRPDIVRAEVPPRAVHETAAEPPIPLLSAITAIEPDAPPRRSRVWLGLGIAAAIALAVAAFAYSRSGAGAVTTTYTVERGSLNKIVAARGRIEPAAELEMAARMIGRIRSLMVAEGSHVEAGQVLAVMEDDEIQAQLAQAESRLRQANARHADLRAGARREEIETARARVAEQEAIQREAEGSLERQQRLSSAGLIPAVQLDETRLRRDVSVAQLRSAREQLALLESGARPEELRAAQEAVATAQSEVEQVRAQLATTQVVAPVSGVVTRTFMRSGEVVVLQRPQPILMLADTSKVYVRAEVDESEIDRVQIGQVALVRLPGTDRVVRGTVAEISRAAGRKTIAGESAAEIQDTKVVGVRIELPSSQDWTFGVTASVELVVLERANVVRVPSAAVTREGSTTYVNVRSGSSLQRRAIETGESDDEFVEVVKGLQPGEVIEMRKV